jgi:hypothetical protein
MTTTQQEKKGIPQPLHLHLVRTERTPEQHLDLEFAEAVNALVPPGEPRPRRFYNMADGSLVPARVIARVITDALHAEVDPIALLRAIWTPIKRFIERKTQRRLPPRPDHKCLPTG